MRVKLSKWGNSLGFRVPRALARQLKFGAGQTVEANAERGRLVVASVAPSYRLAELTADMTPRAMHEAFDWEAGDG